MHAKVTRLQYWKSGGSEATCEDAAAFDIGHGLFAIADGVSSDAWSGIWANRLVEHFLATPLLSADPFEAEWWICEPQRRFELEIFPLDSHDQFTRQARVRGTHSTLATLRVSRIDDHQRACIELLVAGDSCIFVGNSATREVICFPFRALEDFQRPPVCLPTQEYNRYFNRFEAASVEVASDDIVLLSTDAVSNWIISCAGGRLSSKWDAMMEITACSPADWPELVTAWRGRDEIEDDDSTVLAIMLSAHADQETSMLGTTSRLTLRDLKARWRKLKRAILAQNLVEVAILAGDEQWLAEIQKNPVVDMEHARLVADAMGQLVDILRLHGSDLSLLQEAWDKHKALLQQEPAAVNLYRTLRKKGVLL